MTEKEMFFDLKKQVKTIDFFSVETGGTTLGVPDIYYISCKTQGWIELKVGKESKKGIITLNYRPLQQWFLNKTSGFTLVWVNNLYFLLNSHIDKFSNENELKHLAIWYGQDLTQLKEKL